MDSETRDSSEAAEYFAEQQAIFHHTLELALHDELRLPGQPEIMLRVREAVEDDSTTVESLTAIIIKDPGLTAYLVQAASSPIYRRVVPPKSIGDVVAVLGFSATCALVTLYSTRNLVMLNNATARRLFGFTWHRLVHKTAIACFLAQELKYRPLDQVTLASLLSEIGSLAVLSVILDTPHTPSDAMYFELCKSHSRLLGYEVLKKWQVDASFIEVLHDCGRWENSWNADINLLDIINLAIYHAVKMIREDYDLPALTQLAAYQKLPQDRQEINDDNCLLWVMENESYIQSIVASFR